MWSDEEKREDFDHSLPQYTTFGKYLWGLFFIVIILFGLFIVPQKLAASEPSMLDSIFGSGLAVVEEIADKKDEVTDVILEPTGDIGSRAITLGSFRDDGVSIFAINCVSLDISLKYHQLFVIGGYSYYKDEFEKTFTPVLGIGYNLGKSNYGVSSSIYYKQALSDSVINNSSLLSWSFIFDKKLSANISADIDKMSFSVLSVTYNIVIW